MKIRRTISAMAVAGAIVLGGVLVPAPSPPAQAFDSVWSLCAGLYKKSSRTTCFANQIRGSRASAAELRCYKGAGIAALETVAGALVTTRDARIIAGVAGVSAVFGCVKTFV